MTKNNEYIVYMVDIRVYECVKQIGYLNIKIGVNFTAVRITSQIKLY